MRILLIIFLLFVYIKSDAQAQLELNQNAASKYNTADKQLNTTYNLIISKR